MEVKVIRYMFFLDPSDGRNLRFKETAPYEPPCDHSICGCTKEVAVRPEGEPVGTRQQVVLSQTLKDNCTVEMVFEGDTIWVTFQFPMSRPSEKDPERKIDHAYFHFSPHKCTVEITGTGEGFVDCSFAHLYFGNEVDTSRFFNGHSPSRPAFGGVDLKDIRPEDVWVHYCKWGHEAYEIFKGPSVNIWNNIYRMAKSLGDTIAEMNVLTSSVGDVRDFILSRQNGYSEPLVNWLFQPLVIYLAWFVPADEYLRSALSSYANAVEHRADGNYHLEMASKKEAYMAAKIEKVNCDA